MARRYDKISATVHDGGLAEPIYSPKEFGEKIGVSLQTMYRWNHSGVLVPNHVLINNRSYGYFTEDQLQDFLRSDTYFTLNHVRNSDLIGEQIGKLHVLGFSDAAIRKGYYGSYCCECDCGSVLDLARSELLSGKHKSCGCRFHDLTGKTFGRWYVDGIAPCSYTPGGSKIFRYYCTCECGEKRIVIAGALTSGASKSCGCYHSAKLSELFLRDLTNQSFGSLTVVSYAKRQVAPGRLSADTMWNCVCECGTEIQVSSTSLLCGRIDSCGCNSDRRLTGESLAESMVRRYLESLGLFEYQSNGYVQYKVYSDLRGLGGGHLSYDFLVTYDGKSWLIECQGQQHYKPIDWFGGLAKFEQQQEHDRRKRAYAAKLNVPLIEIPYTVCQYDKIVSLLQDSGIR